MNALVAARAGAGAITLASARRAAAEQFRNAGLDSPDADARALLQHVLRTDRSALLRDERRVLAEAEVLALQMAVSRRLAHEPVAHIVGEREFWSLPLLVTRATLAPRPETETVVETALKAVGPERRNMPLRIADLGTGTGALILALLSELPQAFGVATDLSEEALHVARANANRLGLMDRVRFVACNFAAALGSGFDLIVSNPPYISTGDLGGLMPEVRDYDPHLALDGGPDGLCAYRALAGSLAPKLRTGGTLVVEVGAGQAAVVRTIFREAGWDAARPAVADLAGVPRAVVVAPGRGQPT